MKEAQVLAIVGAAFTALSCLRAILSKFDGVGPGEPIPAKLEGLTIINKVCVVLGVIVDVLQGNVKH